MSEEDCDANEWGLRPGSSDRRSRRVAVGTGDAGVRGEKTHGVRTKAADGVRAVEEQAGKVLHRAGETLHRVDEFLQDTREDVSGALRAGQEAIRGTRS